MVDYDITAEQVNQVGWSKLRFIIKLFTNDNVQEWLDRAKSMTSLELQQYVKDLKDSKAEGENIDPTESNVAKVSTMTFKVHPDQQDSIRTALDIKKEELDTEYDTVALVSMAVDMLEGNTGQKVKEVPAKITKKAVTKYLEELGAEKTADLVLTIQPSLGKDEETPKM
jgi:hypothetical protein